jgi:hypothetical protein
METLDWKRLASDVVPETGKVRYGPHKHLFTKVAFDVFRLNNSPINSLWTLEDGDDGEQYLVAQYEDEESETLESRGAWMTLSDREGKNITLFYREMPIQRFASKDYEFTPEDIHIFQQTLIEKLSSDKTFVEKLLKSQSEEKRKMLLQQFPELV